MNPNDTQTLTFYNTPSTTLVIEKYADTGTSADKAVPLKCVTFLVTDSSGAVVGSSNGEFITDENGRIVLDDLKPSTTITAREIKTVEGYVLDGTPKSIFIKEGEVQTLKFYNKLAGTLVIRKLDKLTGKSLAGVKFLITDSSGAFVGPNKGVYRTDRNGRIILSSLEPGNVITAKETKTLEGFVLDSTPQSIEIKSGAAQILTFYNTSSGGVELVKVNEADRTQRIPNVTFLVYDSTRTPIDQITTDQNGYAYLDSLTFSGRLYLRELEAPGYILDPDLKTIQVKPGETTKITWQNTPVTGQIQIVKTSADYNSMNGWPAGSPLPGTVFEIYDRASNLVDTVQTDKNGLAVSKQLPLGRYKVVESKSADFYALDTTPMEAELEFSGQIIRLAMTNKSLYTNVSITKRGYSQVMPGQSIRYDLSNIGNNSTVALTSFFWRDTLPSAIRLDKIVTGTYNVQGSYKIVYRTNLSGETWRTMYDNLSTHQNRVLNASPAALGLASNEYVTQFMVVFGVVPANFRQVEASQVHGTVVSWLTGGTQFVNQADVGGMYNGQWIMAADRWVTSVYKPAQPLPWTGY